MKAPKKLIDDVTSGKKVVVVSYIVILETIHVLRQRMTKGHKFETDYDTHHTQIEHRIRGDAKKFMRQIRTLASRGQAILVKPNIGLTEHHVRVLRELVRRFGPIKAFSRCSSCGNKLSSESLSKVCPKCKAGLTQTQLEYRGLGHADLEHALLARLYNVKTFYSGDRSFKQLNSDSTFRGTYFKTIDSVTLS